MSFDATYQGQVYSLAGGTLYDFRDGYFKGVSVMANMDGETVVNSPRVGLTGYYVTSKKGSVGYQTTSGRYIILTEGWKNVGVVPISKYGQSQAQALVNKIIKNNKIIISNNLLCARYANKLTEDQKTLVRELQSRLQARNSALQADGLTKDIKKSYPAGYSELSGYLDALMSGETIGVATWVVVVIAATVIAAMATAAYYAYKKLADESEIDVKYSKELTQILTSKLTPEEYEQLRQETKGIVTKAKLQGMLRGGSKVLYWGMIAIGGYFVYRFFKDR